MPMPTPPALPPSIRAKHEKIFRFADLLGYILSMAHDGDEETCCELLGELAAIHTHPQPKLGHRRICTAIDGQEVMMTIVASLPANMDLSPEFVKRLLETADARVAEEKARTATN